MSEKIQPSHIAREACVYIRQSTMQQVRTRLEGQRRQYDLRERAQALGFQRVVVIDEDQGRSGTGSVERPGFGRLLAAVDPCTLARVRSRQGNLDRAGLSPYLRHSEKPNQCWRLRLGKTKL
jgi:hypothetical protein